MKKELLRKSAVFLIGLFTCVDVASALTFTDDYVYTEGGAKIPIEGYNKFKNEFKVDDIMIDMYSQEIVDKMLQDDVVWYGSTSIQVESTYEYDSEGNVVSVTHKEVPIKKEENKVEELSEENKDEKEKGFIFFKGINKNNFVALLIIGTISLVTIVIIKLKNKTKRIALN